MQTVSVIVVTFQTGAPLTEAVQAVLAQDHPLELILVDNGNPDDVTQDLQRLAETDDRVVLLTGHGNVGFARACNLGARRATGEVLFFLNPDTRLPPDALHSLSAEGASRDRPWMLGAKLINPDGSEQRGARRQTLTPWSAVVEGAQLYRFAPKQARASRFNQNTEDCPAETSPIPVISGACMMLPKEDYWSIGGMDEGYFLHVEDVDFCYRFRQAGGDIYFVPHVEIVHDRSSSQVSDWAVEWHKTKGFLRYFWKNFRTRFAGLPLVPVSVCVLALFAARSVAIAVRSTTSALGGPARR